MGAKKASTFKRSRIDLTFAQTWRVEHHKNIISDIARTHEPASRYNMAC